MEAVLFDMDGVVIDSQPVSNQMMRDCAARLELPLDEEDFAAWAGLSGPQFWELMQAKHDLPEPIGFYRGHYDVDEEIRRYASLTPVAGLVDLLGRLADVPRALATSGSAYRMNAVLDLFGLQDLFAAKVSVDDVTESKPNPEIFLLAAERLSVRPERCVVIEDSEHGVEAACRAGMKCIGFAGCLSPGHDLRKADVIVDHMNAITDDLLRSLFDES